MIAFGENRTSGILLPVSSLPSDYGIGDMGSGARFFADFLGRAGQTYWQILPLTPTASFMGSSPYSSCSVFAGNPLFISPEVLAEDGLIERNELESLRRPDNNRIDYQELEYSRTGLLDRVFERLGPSLDGLPGFREFTAEHDWSWLDGFALFRCLKNDFGGVGWFDWPAEYRDRDPGALDEYRARAAKSLARVKFEQYLFHSQWRRLRRHFAERGVRIIGDVPIYPTYDSADVWANQEIFKLDHNKALTMLAGVPPDYFSKTGQLWGNPVYDWHALRRNGFNWWLRRLELALTTADVLRLDHFRGFAACWEVPPGETTAEHGSWAPVPGEEFFNEVRRRFPQMPFIAEDLGFITKDVLDLRDRFDLPGMRVLIFSFGDDAPISTNSLHNHKQNCVAYTGTHDNNTVRGWFEQEADEDQKRRFSLYLGKTAEAWDAPRDMVRLTLSSVARTAILPMQDVLGLGADARLNTPATPQGNWSWRLPAGPLDPGRADELAILTKLFGRS